MSDPGIDLITPYAVPRVIKQLMKVVIIVTLLETAVPALFMLSPFVRVLVRILQGAGVSFGIYLVYFFGIVGSLVVLVTSQKLLTHRRSAKTGFALLWLVVILHLVSVPFYLWGYLAQNVGTLGFALLQVAFPIIAWTYVLTMLIRTRGFVFGQSPLPQSMPLKRVVVNVAILSALVATYPVNLLILGHLRHTNFFL